MAPPVDARMRASSSALFGDETYVRIKKIGVGSYGEVWLFINKYDLSTPFNA